MGPGAMRTSVHSPGRSATWTVEHEHEPLAVGRIPCTACLAGGQRPPIGAVRRVQIGFCCFQFLHCPDPLLHHVRPIQPEVDVRIEQTELNAAELNAPLQLLHAKPRLLLNEV
jgi:hypothetical protein